MDNSTQKASIRDPLQQSFHRYFDLWLGFAKNCFLRQTEYKIDFVGRMVIEVVWILTQVIFYKSAFNFIPRLANWSEPEIWFFVGSLVFADGLVVMLLSDNLNKFGQIIRLGMLDYYLLYPVSNMFLSALRFVNLISVINLAFGVGILAYSVSLGTLHLTLLSWFHWALYSLLGVYTIGTVMIIVASVAFWTTQSGNLVWLFFELYRLGHRPENLYATWLRRLLLSVFPAAYFISIPVQLALGKLESPLWFIAPFVVALGLSIIARVLWKKGVKLYEGALS